MSHHHDHTTLPRTKEELSPGLVKAEVAVVFKPTTSTAEKTIPQMNNTSDVKIL